MAYKSNEYDYSFDAIYISDTSIALEETNNGFAVYCMNNGNEELICKVPCPEESRDTFVEMFQAKIEEFEFGAEDKKAIRVEASGLADKMLDAYETNQENSGKVEENEKITIMKEALNEAAISFNEEFTFFTNKEPDGGAELRAKWDAIKEYIEQQLDNLNEYAVTTTDTEGAKMASNEGASLSEGLSNLASNMAAIDTSISVEEQMSSIINNINTALADFKAEVVEVLDRVPENDNTRAIVYTVDELSHNIQADLEYITEDEIDKTKDDKAAAAENDEELENEDCLELSLKIYQ